MKLTEKKKLILIHIVYVLALVVILWPLLAISQYNYPSADDWIYGANTYRAISSHEGILNFIKTVIDTVRNDQWEARFMNITLATLQPGIFGEHSRMTRGSGFRRLCNHCMAYDRICYFLRNVLGGEVHRKRKQRTDPSYQCSGHYFAAAVLPEPGRKLLLVYRGSELYLCL